VFPARSWQLPTTAASALSGPEYVFWASHEARPAVASVPAKPTGTGALYQPFALAGRVGVAVACGAVASYFSASDGDAALPATSRQVPPTEAAASSGPE
jgi:hypothetical protein